MKKKKFLGNGLQIRLQSELKVRKVNAKRVKK